MRLEESAVQRGPSVALFARAVSEGPAAVRALVEPLLPTLWTFVARRTDDDEETEDALVETLLRARSDARRDSSSRLSLLGRLLRHALLTLDYESEASSPTDLADRPGSRRLREFGFLPNHVVPRVTVPPWTFETLARVPARQGMAVGMRLGDGLPAEVVAEVLGTDVATVRSLVESGVREVQEACRPDSVLSRVTAAGFDSYVADQLSGESPPPPEVSPGLHETTRALMSTRTAKHPPSALGASVWRRYGQERELLVDGETSSWPIYALLVGALLLALVGGSLWLISRRQEPTRAPAISLPPAPTATRAPVAAQPPAGQAAQPSSPGPERLDPFVGRLLFESATASGGTDLVMHDMLSMGRSGERSVFTILSLSSSDPVYAISPLGGRIAYGEGDSLWVRDVDVSDPVRVLRLSPGRWHRQVTETSAYPLAVKVGAVTWSPTGDQLAISTEAADPQGAITPEVLVVSLDGEVVSSLDVRSLVRRDADSKVLGLQWTPSGDGVWLNLRTRAVLLEAARGYRPSPTPTTLPSYRQAHFSPTPHDSRMLLLHGGGEGGAGRMEVVDPRTMDRTSLGEATSAAWYPDGKTVIYTAPGEPPAAAEAVPTVRLLHLPSSELSRLGGAPGVVGATSLAFAPDGRHLAYAAPDGLYLGDHNTGEYELLPAPNLRPTGSLHWLPSRTEHVAWFPRLSEGGTVLWVERGGSTPDAAERLMALSLGEGRRSELLSGDRIEYAVSPLGSFVAVVDGPTLSVIDLETGELRSVDNAGPNGRISSLSWSPSGHSLVYVRQAVASGESGAEGVNTPTSLWSVNLQTGERRALGRSDPQDAPARVKHSPSGRLLLVTGRRTTYLTDLNGRRVRTLPPAEAYRWGPDPKRDLLLQLGEHNAVTDSQGRPLVSLPDDLADARWFDADSLLLIGRDATLTRLVYASGLSRRVGKLPQGAAGVSDVSATLSPQGRLFLTADGRRLTVTDTRSGSNAWLLSGEHEVVSPTWVAHYAPLLPLRAAAPGRRRASAPGPSVIYFSERGVGANATRRGFDPFWVYDPASKQREMIADAAGWDVSERDGRIAYTDPTGLWILDRRAGEERLVVPFNDGVSNEYVRLGEVRWSPKGDLVAFVAVPRDFANHGYEYIPPGVHIYDVAAEVLRPPIEAASDEPYLATVQWSSDGLTVFVGSSTQTTEYNLKREKLRVTTHGDGGETLPSPAPKVESVLTMTRLQGRPTAWLVLRHANGLNYSLNGRVRAAVWSPDGGSAFYFVGGELWQASRDGAFRRLVANRLLPAGVATSPVWTPSGELAYSAGGDAWAINVDTGLRRLVLRRPNALVHMEWAAAGSQR